MRKETCFIPSSRLVPRLSVTLSPSNLNGAVKDSTSGESQVLRAVCTDINNIPSPWELLLEAVEVLPSQSLGTLSADAI